MEGTELIIALVGAITTVFGAILGNIQGRKKSNAEAGLMQVQTLEEIRKFYQTTIASQAEIVLKRDERISILENELAIYKQKVDMLQQVVSKLMYKKCSGDQNNADTFSQEEVLDMLNQAPFDTRSTPTKKEKDNE